VQEVAQGGPMHLTALTEEGDQVHYLSYVFAGTAMLFLPPLRFLAQIFRIRAHLIFRARGKDVCAWYAKNDLPISIS
jgi:hypothetical protein